jgi:hypothetical protein
MPMDCWPGRPKGHGPAEIMQAWQASGVWASGDRECLWIAGLAGVRGAAQRSLDCVCLWISSLAGLRGTGLVEQRSCRPVRVLGAWTQQSGDQECLWIAGLAGLRGAVRWRSCRCEWWEFGGVRTGGAEEQAQGLEIPQPVPLAVLLVNHGMGKPSMS